MTNTALGYDADHYVPRLDLADDPFGADFDSDYFYGGAICRQQLEQLIHYGRFSDQVVLLLGASGTGTSALLDQVLPEIQPLMDWCVIEGDVDTSPDLLMASLCDQLSIEQCSPMTPDLFLSQLKMMTHIEDTIEPIFVAVDQAHFVDVEAFQLLNELVDGASGALHLLLVGEYQVEQLTQLAQFDREKIKVLELDALNEEEVGEYVLGLLRSVGYAGKLPLSTDQLAILFEKSKGNMADINVLIPALLDATPTKNAGQFLSGIPIVHVAAIVLVALVLFTFWAVQSDNGDDNMLAASGQKQRSIPITLLESSEKSAEKSAAESTNEPVESSAISGIIIRGKNTAKPVSASMQDTLQVAQKTAETGRSRALLEELKKDAPVIVEQQEISSQSTVAKSSINPLSKVDALVSQQSDPALSKSAQSSSEQSNSNQQNIPVREQRLLSFAKTAYVLQLMGSVEEQRTRNFVKQYVGRLPVTYFEARLKDKPWFVAVTGPFSSRAEALARVKALPQTLQKQKPWARSIEGVQRDIRNNRF
jgi:DamX protein